MTTQPIVPKVWSFCTTLRDDGVSYGDYLEQLTYLIFLKMADEYATPPYNRNVGIPTEYDWSPFPCLSVAGVASHRFWGDGETDPERPQDLHHRADAGVALAGQRLVQAGPAQVGFVGDGGHAHSARHGADRLDEKFRVVFFERGFQVFEPGFVISQKLGTVPRDIRFFFHVAFLECARHALRAADVLLLTYLIATT